MRPDNLIDVYMESSEMLMESPMLASTVMRYFFRRTELAEEIKAEFGSGIRDPG